MSFAFEWPRFSEQFHRDAIQMLNTALNKGNKPPVIADRIEVVELEMGTQVCILARCRTTPAEPTKASRTRDTGYRRPNDRAISRNLSFHICWRCPLGFEDKSPGAFTIWGSRERNSQARRRTHSITNNRIYISWAALEACWQPSRVSWCPCC
jgi:hypothetical protein